MPAPKLTICKAGLHPMNDQTTYINNMGFRLCKACVRARQQRYRTSLFGEKRLDMTYRYKSKSPMFVRVFMDRYQVLGSIRAVCRVLGIPPKTGRRIVRENA